jgi:hypothetical protein
MVRSLSDRMVAWGPSLSAHPWAAFFIPQDGAVIVYDNEKMIRFENISDAKGEVCAFDKPVGQCNILLPRDPLTGIVAFQCEPHQVRIGKGICQFQAKPTSSYSGSMWEDVVRSMSSFHVMAMEMRQTITVHPPLPEFYNGNPQSMDAYVPLAGFLLTTIGSARRLGSDVVYGRDVIYGDQEAITMLGNVEECQSRKCILDTYYGYDALDQQPLRNAAVTWHDILQDLVLRSAAKPPQVTNLRDLKQDQARYRALLDAFLAKYDPAMKHLAAKAILKHPITRNIYAIRGDRVVQITRSGVVVQLASGKCRPSSIRLCPRQGFCRAG